VLHGTFEHPGCDGEVEAVDRRAVYLHEDFPRCGVRCGQLENPGRGPDLFDGDSAHGRWFFLRCGGSRVGLLANEAGRDDGSRLWRGHAQRAPGHPEDGPVDGGLRAEGDGVGRGVDDLDGRLQILLATGDLEGDLLRRWRLPAGTNICAMQEGDAGLSDAIATVLPADERVEELRREANDLVIEFIDRAKAAGKLRGDFVGEDLLLLLIANAAVLNVTRRDAPNSSRRMAALFLEAVSTRRSRAALPDPPSSEEMLRAMTRLATTRGCAPEAAATPADRGDSASRLDRDATGSAPSQPGSQPLGITRTQSGGRVRRSG
jgi:hypothetical protein